MMIVLLSYLCLNHSQDEILMANQTANLDTVVSLLDYVMALHWRHFNRGMRPDGRLRAEEARFTLSRIEFRRRSPKSIRIKLNKYITRTYFF